jgi:hypothetical protein
VNSRQPDDLPTCATCFFWREFDHKDLPPGTPPEFRLGQCRRNPPAVFLGHTNSVSGPRPVPISFNPQTVDRDFCGEHPDIVTAIARVRGQALKDGENNALFYDRARRDLNRVPTPQEFSDLAAAKGGTIEAPK